ncbi:hypothetical protein ACSVDA_22045 [Cytobacillus sp. Hm23]
MKNTAAIFLTLIIFLFGCVGNSEEKTPVYNGTHLQIGVVGNEKLPQFVNVAYSSIELESLVDDNENYDGLFITPDAFSEADKEKYVSFFNSISYPVYFFNIQGYKYNAFVKENVSLKITETKNSPYVQGFKNKGDGERTTWGFYLEESGENITIDLMLRIFDTIE